MRRQFNILRMAKMFTASRPGGDNNAPAVDTLIGEGIKVEGNFSGTGNLTVKGQVVGTLKTSGDLVITETAKVEANVEAQNILVAGEVHGNIVCQGALTIKSSARIAGDMTSTTVAIETGAHIKGQCTAGTDTPTTTEA